MSGLLRGRGGLLANWRAVGRLGNTGQGYVATGAPSPEPPPPAPSVSQLLIEGGTDALLIEGGTDALLLEV